MSGEEVGGVEMLTYSSTEGKSTPLVGIPTIGTHQRIYRAP